MNDLISRVLYFAKELSTIPNSPYLYGPMLRKIGALLEEWEIPDHSVAKDLSKGCYWRDEFGLYVHFYKGKPSFPLMIDSHLDHPGFVFNSKGQGVGFGSLGFERISYLLSNQGFIDLRLFNSRGELNGLAKLTDIDGFRVRVETKDKIENNSHGHWNVADFQIKDDKLLMYSADNMIVTDVMLALIEQVILHPDNFPDLNVTFVFTFLEEVFEASATGIAMKRKLPIGSFDNDLVIIVLESMEPVPLISKNRAFANGSLKKIRLDDDYNAVSLRMKDRINADEVSPLYRDFKLPVPNSGSGVAIKVNDTDCVYGYEFVDHANLAENALLMAAEHTQASYQHTLFGGACNGTAFSLFDITSNISTLSVPNPLKHNIGVDGAIVPEEVKISDVENATNIMLHILLNSGKPIAGSHELGLSKRLKQTELLPKTEIARKLRAERGTIAWGSASRLKSQRYFHDNLVDYILDKCRGVASRAREAVLSRYG